MRAASIVVVVAASALIAGCGCGGDGAGKAPATGGGGEAGGAGPLADSWMHYVAQDPSRLGAFEGPTGEAWLSFYHNDLRRAATSFDGACTPSQASIADRLAAGYPCIGAARTHLEMAELYLESAEIHRVALRQFHKHRDEHAEEVLPSVHAPYFAGVTLLHSGDRDGGLARLSAYAAAEGADPFLAGLARWIGEGMIDGDPLVLRLWGGGAEDATGHSGPDELPASAETEAYRARFAFAVAVATGDIAGADSLIRPIDPRAADLEEVLTRAGATSVDARLRHHDALYLYSRARYHAARARDAAGGAPDLAILTAKASRLLGGTPSLPTSAPPVAEGLPLVVFSGVPNPQDLLAAERAHPVSVATLQRLKGLVPALGSAPSADLSDLDPFVEGSNTVTLSLGAALSDAGPSGGALNADMGLAERFRGHLLRERAVQFQTGFDVRLDDDDGTDMVGPGVATRSLLEYALDKNPSPPNMELKQARISYLNDPPLLGNLARAELDTRRPGEANDYIRPLSGVYPELIAVRDSLTLLDTAWNPPTKDGASIRSQ